MYFHTNEYIYLTYFNDEIIALDLRNDQYILLTRVLSEVIFFALNNEFYYVQERYVLTGSGEDHLPQNFDEAIKYLQEIGILSRDNWSYPNIIPLAKRGFSTGAPNVDWKMTNSYLGNKAKKATILEAYLVLISVYFIIKVFGFYGLIKAIKRKKMRCIKKDAEEFNVLVTALNKACFYFPVRIKCLEWSAALTFMGLRRKWKCNLEIGVQNLPFAAHAWVKADNKVIADTENLPETLSVILSEPFT